MQADDALQRDVLWEHHDEPEIDAHMSRCRRSRFNQSIDKPPSKIPLKDTFFHDNLSMNCLNPHVFIKKKTILL